MSDSAATTLLRSVPESFHAGPEWLRALRMRAADALRAKGLPSKKTEAWRFTPVRSVVDAEFGRADGDSPVLGAPPPADLSVRSLRTVLEQDPDLLQGRLDFLGEPEHFAALNSAMFTDGLWIDIPAGRSLTINRCRTLGVTP